MIAFLLLFQLISNSTVYVSDFDRHAFGGRFCKSQFGIGEATDFAGAISDGRWDDAENVARRRARNKACKTANESAKVQIPSCPEGCYPRYFMLDRCDFEDQELEAGEGESDEWFRACKLEQHNSNFCEEYKKHYHQWAILTTRAKAKVELLCLKK